MITARPQIGYLVPQFPGQTHSFFWREISALEAAGVAVALYSTRPPPPGIVAHDWSAAAAARTEYLARRDPASALRALPAVPWREVVGAERGFARDLAFSLGAARALVESAARHGLRHVHVHSCGRAALIAALAERLGGPSYSLTLHGPLSDYGPGQGFKWRRARFATVITMKLLAEVRAALREDCPTRLVIQPMGVDTERFRREAPYEPAKPGEVLRLFCCARLNPAKGYPDLLAALRLLADQGVDARLTIAGEDDAGGTGYRAVVEARIKELRLDDRVTLLGAVDEQRVREQLFAAHAFVLASHHEPLGVALMEAMACGVPTIGTAAGGVPELITHAVDGILVPPREPQRLADAIVTIARDPRLALALSEGGRRRALDFDASQGAETLMREVGLGPPGESGGDPPARPSPLPR